MHSKIKLETLVNIKTGKLDANASSDDGIYPFFTCAITPLKINDFAYDCECVLVAGNGDLNVKYYKGKFNAYQRTYIIESKNNKILNTKFLFWFLSHYIVRLRQQSAGGVIKFIKLNHLTNAYIISCSIDKQNDITNTLENINRAIENEHNLLIQYDELIKSRFMCQEACI